MIPDVDEILRSLLARNIDVQQAKVWIDQHIELAATSSTVTVNIPALDRIANLIEKEQARA